MDMIFKNSREIKGMLRSIDRRENIILKDYYLLEGTGIYYDEVNNEFVITKKKNTHIPLSIRYDLNEIYNYYYSVDYNMDLFISYLECGCYYGDFKGDKKKKLVNFLTDLLEVMRDIEKYNEYLDIIKENKDFCMMGCDVYDRSN